MDMDGEGFGSAFAFEVAPAALFGTAVGFAIDALSTVPLVTAGLCGAVAFLLAWRCLRLLVPSTKLALPPFEKLPFDPAEPDVGEEELPAAEAALPPLSIETSAPGADELLLDDILASLEPDSRVVRLFQPGKTPTPGELQARIDHHLRSAPPRAGPPDASEALHEAIAELRRSLR